MFSFIAARKNDFFLSFIVILFIILSLITLNSLHFASLFQYLLYIAFSLLIFLLVSNTDYEFFHSTSKYFYLASISLLLFNLVVGQINRGVVRWLSFGSFSLQVSEIVRPFLLVHFAEKLSNVRTDLGSAFQTIFTMAIPLFLIVIQPSLGMTLVLGFAFMGQMLFSKINKLPIILFGVSIIVLVPFVLHFLAPYQKQRLETFLNPGRDPLGAGYNSIQAKIAVGSGGILGKGLGKGVQTQLSFLPEKQTDFVFASIAEEFGFWGGVSVLLFYGLLFFRLASNFESQPKNGRLFIVGVIFMLGFQVFINIGMNLGLVPITGIPLPLISAGGSSLLSTLILIGIAASIRGSNQDGLVLRGVND